tara:strand:- start:3958 stop:4473 length:516 start_codon:yes stop_codon:yes gene_type:complete
MTIARIPSTLELHLLKNLVIYDQETGIIKWTEIAKSRHRKPGDEIKRRDSSGYLEIRVGKRRYKAHRVAWFLSYKEWPNKEIDHINGIKHDNRILNLRLVTTSENQQNRKYHRRGMPVGVDWHVEGKKWRARAPRNFLNWKSTKSSTYIGLYNTIDEARQAVIDFCSKEQK